MAVTPIKKKKKKYRPKIVAPREYAWKPQQGPQLEALLATWCQELLFGGARGGGKSYFLLGDYLQDVNRYGRNWNGILFRKSYTELEQLIRDSADIYIKTGALYGVQAKEWRWPNGATLRFAYLEREADAEKYQGHAYQWIGFDELGNYASDVPYRKLLACLRSGAMEIPTKRIRSTANPGGPGHMWIQEYFRIRENPRGYEPYDDPVSGMSRIFIPSRVEDNKVLMQRDPGYVKRLKNLGSPALVKAWLEGDWSAIQGAFFEEFNPAIHVLKPFELPEYWPKWVAMDWGYAKPFSIGWYTISDSSMEDEGIPSGSIIKYREWYGCNTVNINEGVRLTVDMVAAGIRQRTKEKIEYIACDPSMFIQDGGPSLAETMMRPPYKLPCIRADNKRIPGWNRMRSLLKGEVEGDKPKLYFFDTCKYLLQLIPIMQHDKVKFEDMDTDGPDHALDETRYSVMSRISARQKPDNSDFQGLEILTLNKLWDHYQEHYGKQRRF